MTAREHFYEHKRNSHKGSYVADCEACQRLWAALLRESLEKSGQR